MALKTNQPEAAPADPEAPRRRGPNAERRQSTRAKLLNATIECLHELGYHRTSTVIVTERAGVSRGSLLHQFPTKADLMVATAREIARQRGVAHYEGLKGVPVTLARMERLVDILWGEVNSPSGIARIEIMLASRSEPELAAKYAPMVDEQSANHRRLIWRLAKALGVRNRAPIDAMVQLYSAAIRGLAIDALFPHSREQVQAAVELLKQACLDIIRREVAAAQSQGGKMAVVKG
jgi:AcrR family transcriptional regulator